MTATKSTLIECPKCRGAGILQRYRGIANGSCFLCFGERRVTEAAASKWYAGQMGGDVQRSKPVQRIGPIRPAPVAKHINLPGFGIVAISRTDDGFRAAGWVGGGDDASPVYAGFTVTDGRVTVTHACSGWSRTKLQAALQAAYRG